MSDNVFHDLAVNLRRLAEAIVDYEYAKMEHERQQAERPMWRKIRDWIRRKIDRPPSS